MIDFGPNPGTTAAAHKGCICLGARNEYGKGDPPGVFLVFSNCPLHGFEAMYDLGLDEAAQNNAGESL